MIDSIKLQKNLMVNPDGNVGAITLSALFARFGAKKEWADELGLSANVHFREAGLLDNPLFLAHFMAQCAHESDNFKAMEEYASGAAYEGRKDLGNLIKGDGVRYKGRGPIQGTGRANYRKFGQIMGVDLERRPEILSYPSMGLWFSCLYWTDKKLNSYAALDDILTITKRINGGTNGLDDRKAKLAKAKGIIL